MNLLIRSFRRSTKAAFTPLSIFLLGAVFVSSFGFWSCSKKDYTTQDEIPTGTLEVKNNVSIDEAKRVYEAYLKQKPKNSRTLNVRGDEDVEAQIIWESAQSYNYTDTSGNLISTSTNVYIKGEIKKIFFARVYDTVKLLQVYIHPTEEYIKHHNGNVQMNDFDGFVGYRDDHDVFLGGYKFGKGQVVGQIVPKPNKLKSRGVSEGSILLDAVTVTADRPSTWEYTYTSLNYVCSINGGGVGPLNLPRNGNGGNDSNGSNDRGSSTGGGGYSGAYGGIVISPSLYGGRNPTDFLFEMGVRRYAIAYVLETNKRLGIQIGEALDFLGTEDIKETIETFVFLIQTNKAFQDANIEDNYSFRIFLSLHKYLKAGFSGVEFVSLFLDKELFTQVDGFISSIDNLNSDNFIDKFWDSLELDEGLSNLNAQERALALANKKEFLQYGLAAKDAIAETKIFTKEELNRDQNDQVGNDRNNINAFQHSYWNASLSVKIGTVRAKVWTDAHESGLPNNPDTNFASNMDFFNNHKGREIFETWRDNPNLGITLAGLVKSWLHNGQMQYVCFDSFDGTKSSGYQYVNQRLKFTNQPCP